MQKMKFHWVEQVIFSSERPEPYPLLEDDAMKMVLVGLEPGQHIPAHPAPPAVYYFIEGSGWMTLDETRIEVGPGVIICTPDGAQRSIDAETRLVFLGVRSGSSQAIKS